MMLRAADLADNGVHALVQKTRELVADLTQNTAQLATVATEELRDRPEPHDTLGSIYLQKQLPVHALPAFQRAVELAPQNALYKKHLEEARARSADPDRNGS